MRNMDFSKTNRNQEPMESTRRGEDTKVVVRHLWLAEAFEGLCSE